ncbi:hypothetical protein [Streptomyces spiralis]|uniref:hypothetical protein n=1 Tax=Streptomyces spiralis TaxID=66376 RepID=UPI003F4D2278
MITTSCVSQDSKPSASPPSAPTWLSGHGATFGLCQIHRNEAWHYELRPGGIVHGCPNMYADPTQDPRMQQ